MSGYWVIGIYLGVCIIITVIRGYVGSQDDEEIAMTMTIFWPFVVFFGACALIVYSPYWIGDKLGKKYREKREKDNARVL